MSDVFSENRSLEADPLVILFEMDYTTGLYYQYFPNVTHYYFTNNTGGDVTFGGKLYHATGCNYSSDTITIDGKIPRAQLDLDLQDVAYRPIINYSQLNIKGVRLKVIYTRKKYLIEPNPVKNVHYEQETWYADNFANVKKATASLIFTVGIGLEQPLSVGGKLNGSQS